MRLKAKQLQAVKWVARIASLAILLLGLPFYFGYGNPLPFTKPQYTLLDNTWLSIFPLMFLGLLLGWRYEKIGGCLLVIPITLGLVLGLVLEAELIGPMLAPLAVGALYLVAGYGRESE